MTISGLMHELACILAEQGDLTLFVNGGLGEEVVASIIYVCKGTIITKQVIIR